MTNELRELSAAALDGRITPEQAARLQALVLSDPAARRYYAEAAHLNAALRFVPPPLAVPGEPAPRERFVRRYRLALAGLAASVAAGVGLWLALDRSPRVVARIVEAKACKWDSGTLPTAVGADLPAGRLRLAEGLTRLTFASGAEVTVEGPADLELVSPMRCVVHAGQLTAKVPPAASGFVVETPTTVLTDIGTEFGLTVRAGETADVQVFSGQVDSLHRATGRADAMRTGERLRFTPDAVKPLNPETDILFEVAPVRPRAGTRQVQISTALGRGKDAFVQPIPVPADRRSDTLLLVKKPVPSPTQDEWHRKAYLGFDLSPLTGTKLLDAELSLTFAPTGYGFAAKVPDCTFAVYGLADDAGDDWDERAVTWATAPANGPKADLDAAKVAKLGTFVVAQGEQSVVRTVGGRPLAEFLARDANRLATLILVRETAGIGSSDLVHGVASRRHPTLSPPTLRVTVADTK